MQNSRLFDDAARVANGALGSLMGVKSEIETLVRQRLERHLDTLNLVTRDEFEAVQAMAEKARRENEELKARLDKIEAQIAPE